MTRSVSPKTATEILKRRAEKAAAAPAAPENEDLVANVAVLGVGTERFGVPIEALVAITRTPPIAHLPGLPTALGGVAQFRGELIGAIDIARWFVLESAVSSRLLAVVEGPPGKIGLLVDSVLGFRAVIRNDINESFCSDHHSIGKPISGTTKDLIALINMEGLFASPDIVVGTKITNENPALQLTSSTGASQREKGDH